MAALLLRLAGPLQSWGGYRLVANMNSVVPTAALPRKSGINGLIGAAIGSRELDQIGERYDLHVRVERTNPVAEDFQVIGPLPGWIGADRPGVATVRAERATRMANASTRAFPTKRGGGNFETTVSRKDYLSHTEFFAAIDSDPDTAREWLDAFRQPRFMPYLGRKACPPVWPFLFGIWPGTVEDLFATLPHVARDDDPDTASVRGYRVTGDYDTHDHQPHHAGYVPPADTREGQLEWARQHLSR